MPRNEIVGHLEAYATSFAAPVREGVEVSSLNAVPGGGFALTTAEGVLRADEVVLATGAYQRPHRPGVATPSRPARRRGCRGLPQPRRATGGTRPRRGQRPDRLPARRGATGSGAGVFLACGRAPSCWRRIGGRDVIYWAIETGRFDETLDDLPSPSARLIGNMQATGHGGGHDLHYRVLQQIGVTLIGHFLERRMAAPTSPPTLPHRSLSGTRAAARRARRSPSCAGRAGSPRRRCPTRLRSTLGRPKPSTSPESAR